MFEMGLICISYKILSSPPASKARRGLANLTERKNPHTPVNGVKEFVCPSVVFLAGNNYPDWPYSQGGMKFATQILPLLNYIVYRIWEFCIIIIHCSY